MKAEEITQPIISDISIRDKTNDELNDAFFALVFVFQLFVVSFYGLSRGVDAVNTLSSISITSVSSHIKTYESSLDFIGGVSVALTVAIATAASSLVILGRISNEIITFVIVVSGLLSFLAGIILFTNNFVVNGLFLIVFTAYCGFLFFYFQSRIAFASINLRVACQALQSMPSLAIPTVIILLFLAAYCFLWVLAAIGIASNESSFSVTSKGASYDLTQCSTYSYSSVCIFTFSSHVG